MRRFLPSLVLPFALTFSAAAQSTPAPQTARQALIEMFFGSSPNHLEKHLPDATRNVFRKMRGPNGMSTLDQVSMFATMAKAGGGNFETFDTGPVLLHVEDPRENQKVEITVEGDNLSGDEDQIELALHVTKDEKEQVLPFVPRFTFVMKTEADVWRLSEISVTLRVPLEDPDFLKSIEQEHAKDAEQTAQMNVRGIITAESRYHSSYGTYACNLADMGRAKPGTNVGEKSMTIPLLSSDLASGRRDGYIFAVSGCDGTQYKIFAEPDTPDSGEKALCSDESGTIRSSADGKATSCFSSGEIVQETVQGSNATGLAIAAGGAAPTTATDLQAGNRVAPAQPRTDSGPLRVRVSQAVMQGMAETRVAPIYPPDAKAARIQGSVVLKAIIGKDGTIENLSVISGHPLLTPSALDAVRQWKYRPYLLNGSPVEVETQVTINFTLAGRSPTQ